MLQSSFVHAVMRPPSVGQWVGMNVLCMCVYTSEGLEVLLLLLTTTWHRPHTYSFIPGTATNRYVILTLPRHCTHSNTNTLNASICRCRGVGQWFIYVLVLHLYIEISLFLCSLWAKKKQSFDCTSAHICNPYAPPPGLLYQLLKVSLENKCEGKKIYRPWTNRKYSRDVLEDILLGYMSTTSIISWINTHVHPP